jgi:hypothetical protein
MPITGNRVSEQCRTCTRDRTECGNCKYLNVDRRAGDRRRTGEVDNFVRLDRWEPAAEGTLDESDRSSSGPSGQVESAQFG